MLSEMHSLHVNPGPGYPDGRVRYLLCVRNVICNAFPARKSDPGYPYGRVSNPPWQIWGIIHSRVNIHNRARAGATRPYAWGMLISEF